MAVNKPFVTRIVILAVIVVLALAWKGRDYVSSWTGTVVEVRESGRESVVVVKQDSGDATETRLPREQAAMLEPGDRLVKDSFSRRIRTANPAP